MYFNLSGLIACLELPGSHFLCGRARQLHNLSYLLCFWRNLCRTQNLSQWHAGILPGRLFCLLKTTHIILSYLLRFWVLNHVNVKPTSLKRKLEQQNKLMVLYLISKIKYYYIVGNTRIFDHFIFIFLWNWKFVRINE